ncbi:uncharacterized protein LOC126789089 isoform X4 [Argentina anserina]|uniref:uncharacterized protein LOC126789089 isoform X2 n=1 Tax=Argentina anserina TaxID=57926 RepID=UPI0021766D1E|nr:uncharacterized protein LOC126789089 isoform X2 [Potentilla anserina]XP_050371106.1 uncharacterized protein LOC126789089 isoform X3 [Potentilla anserina]XP_050371107.1 uncharacterized protein LOC126789089 isoform X4 [Potentilla anserina]
MALAMRGFTLGAPKPSSIQIPSCKSYQQKAMMTMLQTQNQGLKHAGKISRSIITFAKKPIGTGSGPKINQTTSSEQLSASNAGSSNSERTGKKSKEANATPKKSK